MQALDHAAGYLMAAAVVRGLAHRLANGRGCEARTSLARVSALLAGRPVDRERATMVPEQANDRAGRVEATTWGPATTGGAGGANVLGPCGRPARCRFADLVATTAPALRLRPKPLLKTISTRDVERVKILKLSAAMGVTRP